MHTLDCIDRKMDEPEQINKRGAGNRLKAYKYKGHDVSVIRRQREEEGIQLRRQKKEQLVNFYNLFLFKSFLSDSQWCSGFFLFILFM